MKPNEKQLAATASAIAAVFASDLCPIYTPDATAGYNEGVDPEHSYVWLDIEGETEEDGGRLSRYIKVQVSPFATVEEVHQGFQLAFEAARSLDSLLLGDPVARKSSPFPWSSIGAYAKEELFAMAEQDLECGGCLVDRKITPIVS